MCALSPGVPTRVALCRIPSARSRSRNAWAAYSLPRSLWNTSPARGRRRRTAASRTLRVKRASRVRPSAHAGARVLVEHDGQKVPPPYDRQVGDIPDPDPIGPCGDPRPQPVGMLAVEAMQPGIGTVDLHDPSAQARCAHEPRDPASADGTPLRAQRALDARTAVGAAVLLEESLNPPLQLPVLRRAGTLGALSPSVVAGPRDAVYRTEPRHRVIAPVRVDEREDVSFRVAQNRMAFFRRACSSCRNACARSSSCNRRISRGGATWTAAPRFPRSCPSRTAFRHRESMNG